ncbi:MAG: hypothetical protein JW932_10385 [Deltaproteobacteria bacterium]|nr:hypothetical protein [Deltaproteobacteria bacterium]
MARIKIKDLPKDMKISKDIMKQIRGGITIRSVDSTLREASPIALSRKTAGKGTDYVGIIDIPS